MILGCKACSACDATPGVTTVHKLTLVGVCYKVNVGSREGLDVWFCGRPDLYYYARHTTRMLTPLVMVGYFASHVCTTCQSLILLIVLVQ